MYEVRWLNMRFFLSDVENLKAELTRKEDELKNSEKAAMGLTESEAG